MGDPHILQSFDTRLDELSERLQAMAATVGDMVEGCLDAFLDSDAAAAQRIIHKDLDVDRHDEAIRTDVMDILACLAPVASDLRQVLAVEHAASNLERVGDKAKSIAKRGLALSGAAMGLSAETLDLLRGLQRAVAKMLRDAVDALAQRSYILAADVEGRDASADGLYDDLFHHVIAQLQRDPDQAAALVHALFVGKSLECIGDHATNIAEEVRFLLRGSVVSATRGATDAE
ncbi:MAG: phosphate signaling complex protein PhoU [Thermochromatium sp.]